MCCRFFRLCVRACKFKCLYVNACAYVPPYGWFYMYVCKCVRVLKKMSSTLNVLWAYFEADWATAVRLSGGQVAFGASIGRFFCFSRLLVFSPCLCPGYSLFLSLSLLTSNSLSSCFSLSFSGMFPFCFYFVFLSLLLSLTLSLFPFVYLALSVYFFSLTSFLT